MIQTSVNPSLLLLKNPSSPSLYQIKVKSEPFPIADGFGEYIRSQEFERNYEEEAAEALHKSKRKQQQPTKKENIKPEIPITPTAGTIRKKGGNKHANGRKKSNFTTNCTTLSKRKAFLRNKIPRTFPRTAATFHHCAAASFICIALTEDGTGYLTGDVKKGRQFLADPVVLQRLIKAFPDQESISTRRDETEEARKDYNSVETALEQACAASGTRVSSFKVSTIHLPGNPQPTFESYATFTIDTNNNKEVPQPVFVSPPPPPKRQQQQSVKKERQTKAVVAAATQVAPAVAAAAAAAVSPRSYIAHILVDWNHARRQRLKMAPDATIEDMGRRMLTYFIDRHQVWLPNSPPEQIIDNISEIMDNGGAIPASSDIDIENVQHMPELFGY